MLNALLLFAATFAVVFLLGIQQLNVNAGLRLAAFVTSIGITAASLVLYKLLPGPTTALQLGAHFLGGAWGIVASMWAHPHLLRLPGLAGAAKSLPKAINETVESEAYTTGSCELDQLATTIADRSARSDIESECEVLPMGRLTWYDTQGGVDPDLQEWISDARRYLLARGLLIEHPQRPEIVRFALAAEIFEPTERTAA